MHIKNLDSKEKPPNHFSSMIIAKAGFLAPKAQTLPIYFVSPSLMDRIAPPFHSISRKCLADLLPKYRGFNEPEDPERYNKNIDEIWNKIEECEKVVYDLLGVYLRGDQQTLNKIRDMGFTKVELPATFVCPERIYDASDKIKPVNASLRSDLFLHVTFHELAHAYADNGKSKNKLAEAVIEESLAEAAAFLRFNKVEELENVAQFISDQSRPAEYLGYVYWTEVAKYTSIMKLLDEWKNGIPPVIPTLIGWHNSIVGFYPIWRFGEAEVIRILMRDFGYDKLTELLALEVLNHS